MVFVVVIFPRRFMVDHSPGIKPCKYRMTTTWFPCRKSFTFGWLTCFKIQDHSTNTRRIQGWILSKYRFVFQHRWPRSSHMCRMGRLNIYRPQHGTPVDFFRPWQWIPKIYSLSKKNDASGVGWTRFHLGWDTTTFKLLVSCAASRYPRDSKRWIPGAIWSLDFF